MYKNSFRSFSYIEKLKIAISSLFGQTWYNSIFNHFQTLLDQILLSLIQVVYFLDNENLEKRVRWKHLLWQTKSLYDYQYTYKYVHLATHLQTSSSPVFNQA